MTDYLFGAMMQADTPINISSGIVAANVSVTGSSLPTNGLYLSAANTLGFATASTQKMILDANGNVGIATTSMSVRLQVSAVSPIASATWAGGTDFMNLFSLPGSSYSEQSIAFQEAGSNIGAKIGVKNTQNGAMDIIFANRNTSSLTSTMTERMRITSSGNVSIGVASDQGSRLAVVSPDTATTLYLSSGTGSLTYNAFSGASFLQSGGGDWTIGTSGANNLILRTNAAERMRITNTGNVGIGTSTTSVYTQLMLNRWSTTAAPILLFDNRGTNAGDNVNSYTIGGIVGSAFRDISNPSYVASVTFERQPFSGGASSSGAIVFGTMGNGLTSLPTERMRVDANGNIGIATSAPRFRISIGTTTSTSTATPETMDMGATFSDTAGSNPKLRVWYDGGTSYGFGVSSGQLDYMVPTSQSHGWWNGANKTMTINGNGQLTLPYQPSFQATHSNNTATTGVIIWGNVIYNIGSHYNSTTGTFTAPVAGTYWFKAHTLIQNAPGGEARIALNKNGAKYAGNEFITIKPANSWWTIMVYAHIYCSANDTVNVNVTQTPGALYSDSGYNAFSGHLVG